jgi:tRNA(His) 5'-end guanylyltransferase
VKLLITGSLTAPPGGLGNSKLVSVLVSTFTAAYVARWQHFFPQQPLQYTPAFDARTVVYPTDDALRDYLSWRQTDCPRPALPCISPTPLVSLVL